VTTVAIAVVVVCVLGLVSCKKSGPAKTRTLQNTTGDDRLMITITHGPLRSGQAAHWQLIFQDISNQNVQLTFRTTQRAELVLLGKHNKVVYQWSKGRAFGDVLSTATIGPRKRLAIDLNGPLNVPPGKYQARAGLASTPAPKPVYLPVEVTR
jgi:hypothetical protein